MFERKCIICKNIKKVKSNLAAMAKYCNKCKYLDPNRNNKLSKSKSGKNHHFYGKKFTKEHRQKIGDGNRGKTVSFESRKRISLGHMGLPGPNLGKKFTEEHKRKIRIGGQKIYFEKNKISLVPRYNPKACQLFEQINNEMSWKGQHAENGGEFYIKELGYWIDYYEPNLNLVIEFDERQHIRRIEKDKRRQKEIENYLKCTFIRIHEFDSWPEIKKKICT